MYTIMVNSLIASKKKNKKLMIPVGTIEWAPTSGSMHFDVKQSTNYITWENLFKTHGRHVEKPKSFTEYDKYSAMIGAVASATFSDHRVIALFVAYDEEDQGIFDEYFLYDSKTASLVDGVFLLEPNGMNGIEAMKAFQKLFAEVVETL